MPSPVSREQDPEGVSLQAAVYISLALIFLTQVDVDDFKSYG